MIETFLWIEHFVLTAWKVANSHRRQYSSLFMGTEDTDE